jgi:NADH-quinone oxidoreductase subunit J
MVEVIVFVACAAVVLAGALGVILSRNPVHSALSLVATLFGIAVLFVELEAHLLAAVQVIVYAGAIVILFLFVIMLLGVDRAEDLGDEPIAGQRWLAAIFGLGLLGAAVLGVLILSPDGIVTGRPGAIQAISDDVPNVEAVGELLFTDYIAAFQITAILLTVAVVAAVMMVRKRPAGVELDEEGPNALEAKAQRRAEREARLQAEADEAAAAAAADEDDEDDPSGDGGDESEKAEVDS